MGRGARVHHHHCVGVHEGELSCGERKGSVSFDDMAMLIRLCCQMWHLIIVYLLCAIYPVAQMLQIYRGYLKQWISGNDQTFMFIFTLLVCYKDVIFSI